ncbi:MAG: ABC transporter ATP-binding protein [Candidatus Eremiobacteraeota bacterium]|nr:ABC transporter ATP-binding protein [Candidatus Eremiobacteraeota bacterium]MBV8499226.1 ABC transporter ATP-binding protein [Candidatus Eremiobacteraeota bacterium]
MSRRSILHRLAREARPYYPRIALAMAMGVLAGVLSIVPPLAFRIIINQVLVPPAGHARDLQALYLALGLTAVALIVANCCIYGQTYLTAWSGQHLVARLRVRLFERMLNLPLGEFDKWRPGELIARFATDLQIMIDAVSVSVPQLVVALATFISSFATMIYLDWVLTLSLVLVAPVVSFAVSNFQRLIATSTHRAQQRIADLTANLSEILHGQRVVKSFGREQFEVQRFRGRNDDFFGAYMKLTQFIQTQPLVISTIMVAAVVAIMWLSVREVLVGRLDTGKVFMFWGLLVNLMNPMNRVAAFFGDIGKAVVGAGRVFELLDLPVEVRDPAEAIALPAVRGRIEYDDVTFRYKPGEPPALRNVSATIGEGEIVALVGPSGAGKTTLVNLVPRFYEPQEGRLLLDGIDVAKVRLSDLRGAIAIVPQDVQLFRTSILENIRYGRVGATDAEVRAAAADANVDEYVKAFPDGYATEVGERGVRLSGGQRQRIAIARAVLRDPRILILDEATSALDSHSEAMIEEALDRLLPGRTTLIIAHRLSTIRRAHRVLFIEAGCVVEVGTHDELLAKGGSYARLHAAQFSFKTP